MHLIALKKFARNLSVTAALVIAAAAVSPGQDTLIGTAQAGSCTLVSEYVDASGQRWGVYRCSDGRTITRACTRGCVWQVWDFRDEQ